MMTNRLLKIARKVLLLGDDHEIERDAMAARFQFESAKRSVSNSVERIADRGRELITLGEDAIRRNEGMNDGQVNH